MWHYVFLLLRRQPGKSVLASSGFLLAACALILSGLSYRATPAPDGQATPAYSLVPNGVQEPEVAFLFGRSTL